MTKLAVKPPKQGVSLSLKAAPVLALAAAVAAWAPWRTRRHGAVAYSSPGLEGHSLAYIS